MTDVRETLAELLLRSEESGLSYGETADTIIAAFPDLAGWQPIGTAPKDGTRVLAWDGDIVLVVSWFGGQFGGWWGEEVSENPTHWRPLPEPPA